MNGLAAIVLLAFAFALIAGATMIALGAVAARSLFALTVNLAVVGALCAAALLAMGAGDVALALTLAMVGVLPFAFMGVLLLSSVSVKQRRRRWPWATIAGGSVVALLTLVALPDLGPNPGAAVEAPITPWLALLVFPVGLACLGLVGFGERGVFERSGGTD